MAPSAVYDDAPVVATKDGQALEATSDLIDAVNVLKDMKRKAQEDLQHENTKVAATESPSDSGSDSGISVTYDSASKFDSEKDKTQFRQYEEACDRVKLFYKEQHEKQTVAFNLAARINFHSASRKREEMTIWEAMEKLNTLIDESDPDTSLSQIQHLLQSAEAIRRDGKPRWMQLTGLIHDLGKLLYFYGAEGQWDVVGDTFPVGCAYDPRIIYPDTFQNNPDYGHPVYGTEFGIYKKGCGLDNVMLSWGHDEYLYHVVREQSTLPDEALAMIRYHSFYPWHKEGAYRDLMADKDHAMLEAVRAFNPYDLYSKSDEVPSVDELKPYYLELINEFFPNRVIKW